MSRIHRFLTAALAAAAVWPATLPMSSFAAEHKPNQAALRSGIDRSLLETRVAPGDDFFEYVNGGWNRLNPIPPEQSRWGAFQKLKDETDRALRAIVEGLADEEEPTSEARQLRDLYQMAMDQETRNRQGASPLAAELALIESIDDRDELVRVLGRFHKQGISALFRFFVSQDDKNSAAYAAKLWQGGLGLPERGYYLDDSDESQRILKSYREHVGKMFELLGDSAADAAQAAHTIVQVETRLAEASRTPVQRRDREAQYNKKTLDQLAKLTPNIDWPAYWKALGVDDVSEVIVGQPEFFERINEMLGNVSPADWRTYLRWKLLDSTAPYLSEDFEKEHFRFASGVLRGVPKMQPCWKRAIAMLDRQMGQALGRLYVEKHFSPAAKRRMEQLVENVTDAFRERIETRDWMGAETKREALAKLAAMRPRIGYPDKWRDYSGLEIQSDSYVRNILRCRAFEIAYRLAKLGQEVDRDEWFTTPQTVNAYYNSGRNEMVFPAGILQPPFFDPTADDAINYGAIGAVIGHEITHGFDDQGSRSDAEGNLRNWWTAADRARFMAKAEKLVKQYDDCVVLADCRVNGRLTLGENIADLGGVTIAYAAYQKSLAGKPAPVLDDFTGPQRFFMGFAQVWRGADRDQALRLLLRTNPHSPGRFRTLVPLSNFDAFYDAFDVGPENAMYRPPEDRVEIW